MSAIAPWRRQFKSALGSSAPAHALLSKVCIDAQCCKLGHRWRESF